MTGTRPSAHNSCVRPCRGTRGLRVGICAVALAGGLFGLGGAVVAAQVNDTQTNSQSTSPTASESLETIVVTARKREERLQDVPVSITAFSSDTIQNAHIETIDDIGALAPNVNMSIGQDPDFPNV